MLMAKVADLYYLRDLTQQEIEDVLVHLDTLPPE